jgi:peptidoglycan/LPS O-acetylase OafA/YrhL
VTAAPPAAEQAPPPGGAPGRRGSGGHLYAVDLARVLTISLVIAVHLVSGAARASVPEGALVTVFHVSREVFFLVTAFVLVYSYERRPVAWLQFWKRRYLFVVAPYLAWSAIYFLADGHLDPTTANLARFGHDLLTGGARYHLYFLLVSMQIYLVFPLLRRLLKATAGHHGLLLAGCGIYQLGFEWAVQHGVSPGGVLSSWLHDPDPFLPSYLLYVVAGGVAAYHLEAFLGWTRTHRRAVGALAGASVLVALGAYFAQVYAGGDSVTAASAVFQPAVVLESLGIGWGFLALGTAWARAMPARRLVLGASDASFGVYLSHPLVLQGLSVIAGAVGLEALSHTAPPWLDLPILVLVVVPLVYALAMGITMLARPSVLSLVLTGRPVARKPSTAPAPQAAPAHQPTPAQQPTQAQQATQAQRPTQAHPAPTARMA